MRDFFREIPTFLQDYVTRNHWSGFREVQQKSFAILFDTDNHLLITSGTSSGKTEAAMFPVISSLYSDPPEGIGALYISPLKALIDDQFERIDEIIRDADIRVTCWHGDISYSVKKSLIKNPSGIMQTTPESLQSLLFNHGADIRRMFSDLRFIIIDEVHAFMNSTRGLQLLCELESLEMIAGCNPRRIGLSATLSDIGLASGWLKANSTRDVSIVECGNTANYHISLYFNYFPSKPKESDEKSIREMKEEMRSTAVGEYYSKLFAETHPYNCIVFANSRIGAEKITSSLRKITAATDNKKDIEIHHGSISKEIRKHSENRIKNSKQNVTLVSTSTLELGIDIGDLYCVVQKDPPFTSSSFVQRMGRSGRRTGEPIMKLFCTDDEDRESDHPLELPINLIKGIALVELFLKEQWVEPIMHSKKPFGLLYQQTIGYMKNKAGVKPDDLFNDVLKMYPFRNITCDEYRQLIVHLMEIGHIGEFDGSLVIQTEGEKIIDSMDFLATFSDDNLYEVVCGPDLIGYIPKLPNLDDVIALAGDNWRVVNIKRMTVNVLKHSKEGISNWEGGEPFTHPHLVKKMKAILESDEDYPYLSSRAYDRLCMARYHYRKEMLGHLFRYKTNTDIIEIHPWTGSKRFETLTRILKRMDNVHIHSICSIYSIQISTDMDPNELYKAIQDSMENTNPLDLVYKDDILDYEKYDRFVPRSLLKEKFIMEKMDFTMDY